MASGFIRHFCCLAALGAFAVSSYAATANAGESWDRVPLTKLEAGAARIDITPAMPVQLAGYRERTEPSTGVNDALEASVIVFDDGVSRAAIIGVDAIMILQFWGDLIREAVESATGIPGSNIMINASHSHGTPHPALEAEYAEWVAERIAEAALSAIDGQRPVSIGYGEGRIDFNINRRTLNEQGKAEGRLNPDGPVDRRVKVLRIDDGDGVEPMAVIGHVVCHPNVLRAQNTQISGDFAGLGRHFMQDSYGGDVVGLVLQGCSGDIRPNLPPIGQEWRNGSLGDMAWCSLSFGAELLRVSAALRVHEHVRERPGLFEIRAAVDTLYLDIDPNKREMAQKSGLRDRIEDGKIVFPIQAIAVGPYLFIGLPGEPVVAYSFGIEEDLAEFGCYVFVNGFCVGDAGYVPAAHMIDEGGYEAEGPYGRGAEQAIRRGVKRVVAGMLGPGNGSGAR